MPSMSANGKELDRREFERRRVAIIMQEVVENQRELAEMLYIWDMRITANAQCCILPGDYIAVGDGCLCSSRGALVDMDQSDIAELIGAGGLHQVFDLDDLNAPDFSHRINDIMCDIVAQRQFRDAGAYYELGLEDAVAVYDLPSVPGSGNGPAQFAVERRGDRFAFRNGFGAGDVPMAQCDYEHFNPGGIDIVRSMRAEAKADTGPSKKRAYDMLMEQYREGGYHDIEMPSDAARRVPGFKDMSPREQMSVVHKLSTAREAAADRGRRQEQKADTDDQWGPKTPGERRAGW